MASSTIDFFKRVTIQSLQGRTVTDINSIDSVEKILTDGIQAGDTIVDAQMPTSWLGTALDWTVGDTSGDLVVSLAKNTYSATQDLTSPAVGAFSAVYSNSTTVLGNNSNRLVVAGNSLHVISTSDYAHNSYNFVNGAWLLSTAETLLQSSYTFSYKNFFIVDDSSKGTYGFRSHDGYDWRLPGGTGTGDGPFFTSNLIANSGIVFLGTYNNFVIRITLQGEMVSDDWSNAGMKTKIGPADDGTFIGSFKGSGKGDPNGTAIVLVYKNYLVVYNTKTKCLNSYDGTAWKYYDGTGTGTGPYDDGSGTLFGRDSFNDPIVLFNMAGWTSTALGTGITFVSGTTSGGHGADLGSGDRVSSWDFTTHSWRYWDGSGTGIGPFHDKTIFSTDTPACQVLRQFGNYLIFGAVGGGTGLGANMASFDLENNTWRTFDGSGSGVSPWDMSIMGPDRNVNGAVQIESGANAKLVFYGTGGKFTSLDNSTSNAKRYWDGSGSGTGPYNGGDSTGGYRIIDAVVSGNIVYFVSDGKLGSYDVANSTWWNYDGSHTVGITGDIT